MSRHARHQAFCLAAAAAGVLLLAGCGGSNNAIRDIAGPNALVAIAPTVQPSPSVFVIGLPATEVLAGGRRVKLLVNGPALSSAIKGHAVQFVPELTETFTITASVLSGTPVTFTPADFVIRRVGALDVQTMGPAVEVVSAVKSKSWQVSVVQTPGQGLLLWRHAGVSLASFSFVAEND